MMKNALSTPSAETGSRAELIRRLLEHSEDVALKEAGKTERKVSEVKDLQRQSVMNIINPQGSDGAAGGGEDMNIPGQLSADIDKGIEKSDQERMASIGEAKDAYVFNRTDPTVGVQDDADRRIGLADEILKNPEQAKRVAAHELEHTKQETGDAILRLPKTVSPIIEHQRGKIRRLTFREHGAIKAEGGLANHTPKYHGFVETSNAVAQYLNEAGESGTELVEEAGLTNAGFQELEQTIQLVSLKKRLEEAQVETSLVLAP